jgi:hypothetical protein
MNLDNFRGIAEQRKQSTILRHQNPLSVPRDSVRRKSLDGAENGAPKSRPKSVMLETSGSCSSASNREALPRGQGPCF